MRQCPLCSSSKSKLIFTQTFSSKINHNITVCANCGFIFVKNTPKQKFYNEYYKKMSKYEQERDHQLHSRYLQIINKNVTKHKKTLDIGCSTGHLLYLLRRQGYKHLYGIDPSPKCKLIAKEKYNISIESANLLSYKPKIKFDLIILSMILEHISDLETTISKVRNLLSSDGYIFISVPDADNFYKYSEEPFGEFSIEHINFFSKPYLHFLMKEEESLYIESKLGNIFSIWKKNKRLIKHVEKYITLSAGRLNQVKVILNKLPEDVIVWGIGSLTQRLLTTTSLPQKVLKFVDSDPKLVGGKLIGKEIISPYDLKNYKAPILISSFRFRDEIINQIEKMGLQNKIITFK